MSGRERQGTSEDQWGGAAEHWARAAEEEEVGAAADAATWMLAAYDSLEGWWEKILSVGGPLALVFNPLPEADRNAIRDAALEQGRGMAREEGGESVFPATAVGARARKPA